MPRTLIDKAGWLLAAAVSALALTALTGVVHGGSLDPPASPRSTMQSLDDIPGSWSRKLNSTTGDSAGCGSERFQCVLYVLEGCNPFCTPVAKAVLDRETGLVWERTPSLTAVLAGWANAVSDCTTLSLAGRRGWRLPSIEELQSIVDETSGLPPGNPFTLPPALYWSSTSDVVSAGSALGLRTSGALPFGVFTAAKTSSTFKAWCVRGGSGIDGM